MDLAKVEELIRIVKESGVSELTVREDGGSITVRKGEAAPPRHARAAKKSSPKSQPENAAVTVETHVETAITAPMVGIFHSGERGIQTGSVISPGQVVGAIESMKLMNEVIAEVGGVVTEVAVEDGLPVEYGQALFRLAPAEVER